VLAKVRELPVRCGCRTGTVSAEAPASWQRPASSRCIGSMAASRLAGRQPALVKGKA
jgi:hypothetical protein